MPAKKVKSNKRQVTSPPLRATAKQSEKKIAAKPEVSGNDKMSVPVYSLLGTKSGVLELPKEVFAQEVNKKLLAQAVRVYFANQKEFTASTKTRGEVSGSTAKIQRQKGTGRARHGAIRAPIFVGGGIVFGPKPRKVRLDLPKKMKKAALLSALSTKMSEGSILALSGLEKASGKTKEIARLLDKLTAGKKGTRVLVVTKERMDSVVRATRNLPGVDVLLASQVNAYEVLKHQMLVVTKEAVSSLSSRVLPEKGGV